MCLSIYNWFENYIREGIGGTNSKVCCLQIAGDVETCNLIQDPADILLSCLRLCIRAYFYPTKSTTLLSNTSGTNDSNRSGWPRYIAPLFRMQKENCRKSYRA